ncbi:MAG: tetratricopeptide repeat protein [Candidatus Thermoplasmatota archaeon]|nr:tetratricopeptide repeat protein [Candidatus Thermoplasmatota archaeon]
MESKLGRGLGALISQKGGEVSRALSAQDRQRLEQIESEIRIEKKKAEDIRKNLTMEIIMGNNPDMNELRSIESRIIELELDRKDLLKGTSDQRSDVIKANKVSLDNDSKERRADIDMRMLEAIISEGGKPYKNEGQGLSRSNSVEHEVAPSEPYAEIGTRGDHSSVNDRSLDRSDDVSSSDNDYMESIKREIHPRVKLHRLIKESSGSRPPSVKPDPTGNRAVLAPVRKRLIKKTSKKELKNFEPMVEDTLKKVKEMLSRDDLDGAEQLLEIAIDRYGAVEELLYQHGNLLYLKGDLDKAQERFRQVIRLNQNSARSVNNLGVILRKQKKYEEAIRIINQAIEIDPKYEKAWYNLGCIFMEIDPPLLKEASIFLKRAIEIQPDFDRAKDQLRKLNEMAKRE